MDYPAEFRALAMNTFLATYKKIGSEEQIRTLLLGNFKSQELQRLDAYIAEILDSRYSDREINTLWDRTGTDIMFLRPEAARTFPLKIREWIAEEGSH